MNIIKKKDKWVIKKPLDCFYNEIKIGDILVFGGNICGRKALSFLIVKNIKTVEYKGWVNKKRGVNIPKIVKPMPQGMGFKINTYKRMSDQPIYSIEYLKDNRNATLKDCENTMILKDKKTINKIKKILNEVE